MLVNVDASSLDWVCAVYLSQDPIGMEEIINGYDIHTANEEAFGLPSRLIAKIFLFRIIFGGTEYSFATDPDFYVCRMSVKEWARTIEKFYDKYKGIREWHNNLVRTATETGCLSIPTGRCWTFTPTKNKHGELVWPITTIKNYPVQGLEADLMSIARVSFFNRIKHERKILLDCTVHDSLRADCPSKFVPFMVLTMQEVFRDVPRNFKKLFGVEFNLPFRGEISVGKDWLNMEKINVQ